MTALAAFALAAPAAHGLGAGGIKANAGSGSAQLSGDGHQLAFGSYATNLTPEALNGANPYLRDLDTGQVGIVTSLLSSEASLSENARFVAFSLLGQQANVYVGDFAFEFVVPCAETASTLDGGTCALNTTADAVVPGYATEGSRAVHGLGQVQVFDGGPDGDADTTADNSLFAVQGIFVP